MQGEDTLAHVTGYLRGTYHPEREELEKLARLGYTEDYFDLRKKQLVRDLAVYFLLLTALADAAFLGLAVFYRKEAAAWDRTLEKAVQSDTGCAKRRIPSAGNGRDEGRVCAAAMRNWTCWPAILRRFGRKRGWKKRRQRLW